MGSGSCGESAGDDSSNDTVGRATTARTTGSKGREVPSYWSCGRPGHLVHSAAASTHARAAKSTGFDNAADAWAAFTQPAALCARAIEGAWETTDLTGQAGMCWGWGAAQFTQGAPHRNEPRT